MRLSCPVNKRLCGEIVVSTLGDERVPVMSYVCSERGGAQGLIGFGVAGLSTSQGSTHVEERLGLRKVEKLKYHVGALKDTDGACWE